MKNNVLIWTAVKNDKLKEKYGGWDWFDYSEATWKYWCDKNKIIFIKYTEPKEKDLMKHRVTWQRWFDVFDLLKGVEYDKVWMIDAASIIKWDAPNIFELVDDRFTAFRDTDNLKWVYDSVYQYESFFDFTFDMTKYFNCGNVIFNKNHEIFFKKIEEYYCKYEQELIEAQNQTIKLGTDQTPVNYLAQIHDIDINLDLPFVWNLTHIHRKEMFGHNWQLNEDKTPFFIKYGYLWRFNGIPKDKRTEIMGQTWEIVKGNYNENSKRIATRI